MASEMHHYLAASGETLRLQVRGFGASHEKGIVAVNVAMVRVRFSFVYSNIFDAALKSVDTHANCTASYWKRLRFNIKTIMFMQCELSEQFISHPSLLLLAPL